MFDVTIAHLSLVKESHCVTEYASYHKINQQIHMKIANKRVIPRQPRGLHPRRTLWLARLRSSEKMGLGELQPLFRCMKTHISPIDTGILSNDIFTNEFNVKFRRVLYFSILLHYHKSSLSDVTPSYYAKTFIRFSSSVYSTTTCFGLFYKAIFRWVLLK
jgi:hypothetical protein